MAKKSKDTLQTFSSLDALGLHKEHRGKGAPPAEEPPEGKEAPIEAIQEKPAEKKEPTIQISAYIPRVLYRRVKVALADQDQHTLTSLLIKLLNDWERER